MAYAFFTQTLIKSLQDAHPPHTPSRVEVVMMTVVLFITHSMLVTLISGVALQSTSLVSMMAVSLILSCVTLGIYSKYMRNAISLFTQKSFFHTWNTSTLTLPVKIIVVLFVFQLAISSTRSIIAPPNVFDTQVYHLAIPLMWLQDGHVSLTGDVPVERIIYATKLSKALTMWYLRFGGPIEGVEFSQLPGYIVLLTSAYLILRSLSTSRLWSIIGTLLVASIPIIVMETSTLQDHLLLTGMHFALIALFFLIHDNRLNPRMSFFTLALVSSLVLASKFSAPAHVVVIWGVCGLLFWKKCLRAFHSTSWTYLAAGGLSLLGIGCIWYIANFIQYGALFGPKHAQSALDNIFLKNIIAFPMRLFDNWHRYTPDLIRISGFGPHVATFGLVGTIFALIGKHQREKVWALLLSSLALLGIYFTQYYTLYNYRLFIFVSVTFIIVSISYLSKQSRAVQKLLYILIPAGMLYTMIMTIYPDYHVEPVRVYRDLIRHYPSSRTAVRFDYASDKFKRDASWLFIDQNIPESEPILYITQNKGVGYDDNVLVPYFGRDLSRRTYWGGNITSSELITQGGFPTESLIPFMRKHEIHYLHNNTVFYYEPVELKLEGTPFIRLTQRLYYLP